MRGVQYRAYRWTRPVHNQVVMRVAGRRYRSLFTADNEQIAAFPGLVVSDVDDPRFTEREVELLNRPNLAAYVVTAERAARRFESLGVTKPYHVIPQGVSLSTATPELIAAAGRRKEPGTVIVGYMSALMLTADDRDGDKALYNVDHLLDLWEEVRLAGAAGSALARRRGERSRPPSHRFERRHRRLRKTRASPGARPHGELRHRAVPPREGRGNPGSQDGRVHGPRCPDRVIRLRRDRGAPRDRSRDSRRQTRRHSSMPSCT